MIWKSFSLLLFYFVHVFCGHWPPNIANQLSDGDTYDFIVVGSGSAGSPVAARLAERGQNVLLLEAGGEPPLTTVVPGLCVLNPTTGIDWNFTSIYDSRACRSLLKKRCYKARGKVLGGCSSINFMIYIRGNKQDFDDWNIPNWTYDEMFPYFLRLESLTNYNDLSPEMKEYHNHNGPLRVSLLNASFIEWRDHLIEAYKEIGFKRNWDANGPSQIGVTITHATVFAGERQSTAEAYLVPNAKNENLNVAYNSYVTKIIINENNVAKGVKVSIEGKQEITINAEKEIIVSAGTIKTPQLLMLSGIGPKVELKKYAIHMHVDNSHVGQNLHDHPATPIVLTANTGTSTSTSNNSIHTALHQWLIDRTGPLTTTSTCDISTFVDTADGSSVPDIQFMHIVINRNDTFNFYPFFSRNLYYNDAILKEIQELNIDSEILVVLPTVLRPISRGSIHLASGNPWDQPAIKGNTLVEPDDYATYLRGVRIFEKLLATKPFRKNGVKIVKFKSLVECNAHEFQSDSYWKCYRDNLGDTIYHPVGTASIGRVVDEKLRVCGIEKLRVADASVMRLIPRGNTNAATIAIGERAADFIAEDHGFDYLIDQKSYFNL